MIEIMQLKLPISHLQEDLLQLILTTLKIKAAELIEYSVYRRGIDARKKSNICFVYTVDVKVKNEDKILIRFKNNSQVRISPNRDYKFVAHAPTLFTRPIIIGAGPCGIMSALILAQMGFKPLIIERGPTVKTRTKDTWDLWRNRTLHTNSNVQFGEGGAGTFSDGKLYSQVKDPKFYGRKVLHEFVKAGAPEEILWISKPHIGTFRLVSMLEKIRHQIIDLGGEFRFDTQVTDFNITNNRITSIEVNHNEILHSNHFILAIGHSARDTFSKLYDCGVYIESKPFSVGFRIEHPQSVIDKARYGSFANHELLGSADYKLVHHATNGRTVYSFCMCPGGTVVAATSEANQVVTNGMSQYSRNERNANSGFVVDISQNDFNSNHPLAGIDFQRELEQKAFQLGGSNYNAPGQKVIDFLKNTPSDSFNSVIPSYKPGVTPTDLTKILPSYIIEAMQEALPIFNKQIQGYAMDDAVLTGIETRTSSPIRIKRDNITLQSVNTSGLYPCGEGAGYAGGILSAAIDGILIAETIALDICKNT